jgi:2-polyprenyl-6-hydroxyphenyl methylase/3-demethylubiquinone-9 3-methyltransferase
MNTHTMEVSQGKRFEFGANWARFLEHLSAARISSAEQSLQKMLGDLQGKRFLDIGSGSGLFSLAARNLGAIVHSFDFDPKSVACTTELRRRYHPGDAAWRIEEGSVLDGGYLCDLGTFDVVYSWGVLHHTGRMWQAFENIMPMVNRGGHLFIAIYNDQGFKSRYWRAVKRLYNAHALTRAAMVASHAPLPLARYMVRFLTGRLGGGSYDQRGMSLWYDWIDWMGGYPFEVASVAAIRDYFENGGFQMKQVNDVGNSAACNEFVLLRH